MVVINNISIEIILANFLGGRADLSQNPIVKHSRTTWKILTSTQRTGED